MCMQLLALMAPMWQVAALVAGGALCCLVLKLSPEQRRCLFGRCRLVQHTYTLNDVLVRSYSEKKYLSVIFKESFAGVAGNVEELSIVWTIVKLLLGLSFHAGWAKQNSCHLGGR